MQLRKVKLIHGGRVGVRPDGSPWAQQCGDVVELPAAEAQALLDAQQAEPVAELRFPAAEAGKKGR